MANYLKNKPGIDLAEVVSDGRLYPVAMSIPIVGSLGFNVPEYDQITTTEDSNNRFQSVSYSYQGNSVGSLSFPYVDDTGTGAPYTFVKPLKTTTITKGGINKDYGAYI